jgi:hypothetical protein
VGNQAFKISDSKMVARYSYHTELVVSLAAALYYWVLALKLVWTLVI